MLFRPPVPKPLIAGGILNEQNKAVLFGGPKTGKSILAQQLAFCVAAGVPWVGFGTTQGIVYYVQAEISKNSFHWRILKMADHSNLVIPIGSAFFSSKFNLKLDHRQAFDELYHAIAKVKPILLIVDPLYRLISRPDEYCLGALTDALDSYIEHFNLSVVIVHHSRKPRLGPSGIIDMGGWELRGPVIEQWADSIIRVRGDPQNDDRTMDFELRHAVNLLPPIDIVLDRTKLWFNRI